MFLLPYNYKYVSFLLFLAHLPLECLTKCVILLYWSQFLERTRYLECCCCFFAVICLGVLLICFLWTITLSLHSRAPGLCQAFALGTCPQPWASIVKTSLNPQTLLMDKKSLCLYSFIIVRCLSFSTFCTLSSFPFSICQWRNHNH